jgi:hypothetical protein
MADFKKILLNKDKLIEAFEDLSISESIEARANLLGDEKGKGAIESIRSISPELAQMMAKEGLSLSDFGGEKKARKKRVAVLENQKFCKEDGKLKLLITRAISVAEKAGHEILDFQSLKGADAKEAKRLVTEYNA